MKLRYLLAIIVCFGAIGCSSDDSTTDSGKTFLLDSTYRSAYTTPATSYNVTWDGTTYDTSLNTTIDKYAVISKTEINGVSKVGIALSTDARSSKAFNLKIYFDATNYEHPSASQSATIIIRKNNYYKSEIVTLNNLVISTPDSGVTYDINFDSVTLSDSKVLTLNSHIFAKAE